MLNRQVDFEDFSDGYSGDHEEIFEDLEDFDDMDEEWEADSGGDDEYASFLDGEEEYELLYEDGDEFFGALKGLAKKALSGAKKAVKKLGPIAKRHAGKIGTVIGGAVGGPAGAAIGGRIGNVVKNLEDEDDGIDSEDEMNATMQLPSDDEDMAEAMAAAASKSRPADAQALGGALTITIMSKTPLKVRTVSPAIASAAGRIARSMAVDPRAKTLIRALPTIVKDTTASLTRKAKKGKPVTSRTAARVMTKQARRTLQSPPRLATALAKNAVKKRRLDHKAIARAEKYY